MTRSIAKSFKAARSAMNEQEFDSAAYEFTKRFGLQDGDYIEFERRTSHGLQWRRARILYCQDCYWNNRGGYTAIITIVPTLADGRLGKTLDLFVCVNANGTGLRGIMGRGEVRRHAPVANAKECV